jgi:predicted unusual protein kinase regulating ubiquinone biosynthesis (AarF/ABC1/UbiB family)
LVRNLKSDLRLLGFVAWVANWLYPNTIADVREAYRQFAATTLGEGDYAREVANAGWFYEYFKGIPDIIVPMTYKELSSKHIITQDYVGGISLADVISRQKAGFDPKQIVQEQLGSDLWLQMERLGKEFLISTLKNGFVFGDPHPGNIKLLPDNKLALVDFGIAAPTSKNRSGWLNLMREELKLYNDEFDPHSFMIAMLNYYDPELAQAFKVVNRALNPNTHQDILDKVSQIAAEILQDRMDDPMMQSFFKRRMMTWLFTSINEGNRFGIKLNLDDTSLLKAGHTYLNLVAQLGRHNGENLKMLRRALNYASDWAEREDAFYRQSEQIPAERAFEVVSTWLSQVADRDPLLYNQIISSEEVYA